jgi:predicted ATPase
MHFTRLRLQNWKNFKNVDVPLERRVFAIGPNASGKSNLLDVFRFLHDLVVEGGGLARAVEIRGGASRVRSLHARSPSEVQIAVDLADTDGRTWRYDLAFTRAPGKGDLPRISHEIVSVTDANGRERELLRRPVGDDSRDPERLSQTHLQQTSANKSFRPIADFFRSLEYMNLVPQLIREGQSAPKIVPGFDPLGRDFLTRVRAAGAKTRQARLRRIEKLLQAVVPTFSNLQFEEADELGRPHLMARFKHWRAEKATQRETQFSDGTLRLIAMLWLLQERGGPLLLDEPEWSLHTAILKKLASFLARVQRERHDRQVIVATHSEHLLRDPGIGPEEVLIIQPEDEGSSVSVGKSDRRITKLMELGIPASEAALPLTEPKQLKLFDKLTP